VAGLLFSASVVCAGVAAAAAKQLIEPMVLAPHRTKPAVVGDECAAVIGK
jgi:hypothetical protein